MASRSVFFAVLTLCLSLPAAARAQLTTEEMTVFNKLLAEPDAAPAYEKRLRLIGDAIAREGDPKRRLGSYQVVDLKRARIPAAQGVPFLLKWLDDKDEIIKRTALRMLTAYGPEAKAALPRLRQALASEEPRYLRNEVMLTLSKIDPTNAEIAAAILERLGAEGADDASNRAALQALVAMTPVVPRSAVPRLAKFLEHRVTEMGLYAHELIGKAMGLDRPSLEQLGTLKSIDWRGAPDQGYSIFAAIADAGPKAEFAVPLLLDLLDAAPPSYLECVTLETLGKVKSGNPRLIAALLGRLRAKDLLVRSKARMAFMTIDLKEPASVRALAQGLRHRESNVRVETAFALQRGNPGGQLPAAAQAEMLPPLLEALGEGNEKISATELSSYLALLRSFGTRAAPAADALLKWYRLEDYFKKQPAPFGAQLRSQVLASLVSVGAPEAAWPEVLEALRKGPTNEADAGLAYTAAARAVASFADAREAIPLLVPALKVQGKDRAFYGIDWFGDGPGKPTNARLEAIRALGKIGPPASAALPQLREIAESKAGGPGTVQALLPDEARRAYNAIAKEKLPFADAKKDFLHLDERLQVKLTLKLRNPRTQHILERLHEATKLTFTMDDNVDPSRPVFGSIQMNGIPAWNLMRQLSTSPNVQGTWEAVADGYRLVGKPRPPGQEPANVAKAPAPPFVDDTNDPLPDDKRLKVTLTIQLRDATVPDLLRVLQDATGVTLTTENVDTATPLHAGVSWSNTTAWMAMRNIAEAARVQGKWEKTADGYRLVGKQTPAAAPVAATSSPAPPSRLWLHLAVAALVTIFLGLALAWRLRDRRKGEDAR